MGAPVVRLPSGMAPARETLDGNTVRLEPVDPGRHAKALFQRSHEPDPEGRLWDYMPYGPFDSEAAFADWLTGCAASADPLFFAVIDKASGLPSGMTSYLRITPEMGVIETGHIWFAPAIQRSRASTEAIFLMARHVFDALGYRRFEWKCNALNAASKRAALRLGFSYEGTFRQHLIVKGRNRDTAWFAMLDSDWPAIRANFERWLDDANFDAQGEQRISLSELNRGLLRPMLDFDGRPRPDSA